MFKIGVTLDDQRGLESGVSAHFGQCGHFGIAEVEGEKIISFRVVPNHAQHGGGGCQAVDEMLSHGISYVISGGMGMGAQRKFAAAGVQVCGFSGSVQAALQSFFQKNLGGLGACKEHGGECH